MMRRHRGQSLGEYSLFLAIALIAIVTMNVYVKRGLQGRYADVMDAAINAVRTKAPDAGTQYEPYYLDSGTNINVPRNITETIGNRASITRSLSADSIGVTSESVERADQPD